MDLPGENEWFMKQYEKDAKANRMEFRQAVQSALAACRQAR
jgi:hypothetical protein